MPKQKRTSAVDRDERRLLPLPRLRPLCQGPGAKPPAAKATYLYKYSEKVCVFAHGGGGGGGWWGLEGRHIFL